MKNYRIIREAGGGPWIIQEQVGGGEYVDTFVPTIFTTLESAKDYVQYLTNTPEKQVYFINGEWVEVEEDNG